MMSLALNNRALVNISVECVLFIFFLAIFVSKRKTPHEKKTSFKVTALNM